MASTYSSRLRLELMASGEQSGSWGTKTNTNLGTLIEEAIAGYTTKALSDANYTLSTANGATDEARQILQTRHAKRSIPRGYVKPSRMLLQPLVKISRTIGNMQQPSVAIVRP